MSIYAGVITTFGVLTRAISDMADLELEFAANGPTLALAFAASVAGLSGAIAIELAWLARRSQS